MPTATIGKDKQRPIFRTAYDDAVATAPPAVIRRALEIAERDYGSADFAWLRRTPIAKAEAIRRYLFWGSLGEAEREAKAAETDLPREIFDRLADAENAVFAAQMTDDPGLWKRENRETAERLALARKAAGDWRAAQPLKAAE